jgi:TPR repeat protein
MKKLLFLLLVISFSCNNSENPDKKFGIKFNNTESEDAETQYSIGLMYYNGEGKPLNKEKAFYWFEKSAEQGYDSAQYKLALMYYQLYDYKKCKRRNHYGQF